MSVVPDAGPVGRSAFDLTGKTAIVTGAARGIGRAYALGFADAGANVVIADLNEEGAGRVASELEQTGGHAFALRVDHTDADAVDRMVEATLKQFGAIDVLLNNAGVLSNSDFYDMTLEEWDRVMDINLRGPLLCMKAVMPHMVERQTGSVINMGSSWSSRAAVFNQDGGGPDYCASKAAIQALTRSAAQDSAKFGVRVNAIAPGAVDTPMHEHHRDFLFQYEQYIPLGRMQVADDLVGTAIYLASDASRYVTGQTIHVNGGMLMVD